MSEQQEIALGQQSDPEVKREMGVYGDARLQEYVQGIGMKHSSQPRGSLYRPAERHVGIDRAARSRRHDQAAHACDHE